MSGILRKFGKSIFVTITFFSTALFLFASYNHLFDPDKRWYIALTGLALPLLLLFQLLVALCWLFMRSRWVLIPFASLLIGFPAIRTIIAFHTPQTFRLQKDSASIRVMSWNVSWFDGQSNQKRKPGLYRQAMLDFIKDQQADILCFQEYLEPGDKGAQNSHSSILRAMGYAYNHWAGDYVRRNGRLNAGTAIFSRYPIRQTYRWKYEGLWFERVAESLIAADIDVNGQTIRVYTTHLQSLQFNDGDYQTLESIKDPDRTSLKESLGIIRKIRVGYKYRLRQAQLVREQLDASPYPEILCGDFNDVPRSFAYTTIQGNRNDAFLEKGTGIGRTFHAISPTLRIDYILTHPDFKVVQFHKKDFHFSEHYPIMADLRLSR